MFAGGFVLSAAEMVCTSPEIPATDVADLIGNLVDKSLVTMARRDGETRYTLLQTLADYGRAHLQMMDEENAARDRHLAWMVSFAAAAEPALRSSAQTAWVESLSHERENIRAALEWAAERGRADDALAIVSGLVYGWYIKGSIKDSLPLLTAALALGGDASDDRRAVGHAWAGRMAQLAGGATADAVGHAERAVILARSASAGTFAVAAVIASLIRSFRGLTAEAGEVIDEALARLEEEPDLWGRAWAEWGRGLVLVKLGDPQQADPLFRSSIAGFTESGDQYAEAIARISLGEVAELRGDYDEATSSTLAAYHSVMITGANSFNASVRATRLGNLAAIQGDFEQAASWHEQGLRQAREGEFPAAIAQAFSGMGEAARRRGDFAAAASVPSRGAQPLRGGRIDERSWFLAHLSRPDRGRAVVW